MHGLIMNCVLIVQFCSTWTFNIKSHFGPIIYRMLDKVNLSAQLLTLAEPVSQPEGLLSV